MIGMFADYSGAFLRAVALATVVGVCLPIGFAPHAWTRIFRWRADALTDLALYFGRCLAVVAFIVSCMAWHAAEHAEQQPFYFDALIGMTVLLGLVHAIGAVQKAQPWTETAEIPLWAGLAVLTLMFYPAA
jgi:hypothetical protein